MDEVYSTEVQFVGDDLYNRGNLRDMVHNISFTALTLQKLQFLYYIEYANFPCRKLQVVSKFNFRVF